MVPLAPALTTNTVTAFNQSLQSVIRNQHGNSGCADNRGGGKSFDLAVGGMVGSMAALCPFSKGIINLLFQETINFIIWFSAYGDCMRDRHEQRTHQRIRKFATQLGLRIFGYEPRARKVDGDGQTADVQCWRLRKVAFATKPRAITGPNSWWYIDSCSRKLIESTAFD